jgi:H+/gluconate symporter-like permease
MFVLIPLAKSVFKQLDLAWNLVGIPIMLGFGTFTMTMLPGTPSIQNVVPTVYLGTTLTAAPVLGLIATLVAMLFSFWFINYTLKKSVAQGKTFADFEIPNSEVQKENRKVPPLLVRQSFQRSFIFS